MHAFTWYMTARFVRESELDDYRRYVADSLHYAPQGMYMARRWRGPSAPADDRSAEQIADMVIEAAGLEVVT